VISSGQNFVFAHSDYNSYFTSIVVSVISFFYISLYIVSSSNSKIVNA
jgi:hypothetical protein